MIDTRDASLRERVAVLLATTAAFFLLLLTGTRGYETNDNAVIAAIASGEYGGSPDGRLVYVGSLIGYPVAWLYRLSDALPWYPITLYSIHLLAIAGLLDVLRRRHRSIGSVQSWLAAALVLAIEPYREYLEYNRLRGALHGTPRIAPNALSADALKQAGWTPTDWDMFRRWFYDDLERFSYKSVQVAFNATSGVRRDFVTSTFWDVVVLRFPILLMVFGVAVVAALVARNWLGSLLALGVGLIGIASMEWVQLTARLPERVALPMWLCICMIALCTGLFSRAGDRDRWRSPAAPVPAGQWSILASRGAIAAAVVLVLVVVIQAWSSFGPGVTSQTNLARRTVLTEQMDAIDGIDGVDLVLSLGSGLSVQGVDPLSGRSAWSDDRILTFGWPTFSPAFESRTTRIGVDDSMREVLRRPGVLIIADDRTAAGYESFLAQELEGSNVAAHLEVEQCPTNGRCLWKVRLVRRG